MKSSKTSPRPQNGRSGSSQGHRRERLERLVFEELDILLREELDDPALDGARVFRVELSVDYRTVRAYCMSPRDLDPVRSALEKAAPFLRRQLVEALSLKFAPQIRFSVLPESDLLAPERALIDDAGQPELVGTESAAPPETIGDEV